MKKGKYAKKKTSFVKTLAVAMVLVTLIGCAIGGTLAWLTDETQQVVNTFTVGKVGVNLTETNRTYKMIPGWYMDKDPKASVTEDSEDCYLFVKVTKSTASDDPAKANFDDYMTYTPAAGWTELTSAAGANYKVYYKVFNDREAPYDGKPVKGTAYSVLEDDKVWVKKDVTEAMMESLTTATYPTLTFQAYAVQYWSSNDVAFTAAEAWAKVATPAANS